MSTLQTDIPWLADDYRARLQQDDKDKADPVQPDGKDSFVLCPEDRIDSYAELKLCPPSVSDAGGEGSVGEAGGSSSSSSSNSNGLGIQRKHRPKSAKPRLTWSGPKSMDWAREEGDKENSNPGLAASVPGEGSVLTGGEGEEFDGFDGFGEDEEELLMLEEADDRTSYQKMDPTRLLPPRSASAQGGRVGGRGGGGGGRTFARPSSAVATSSPSRAFCVRHDNNNHRQRNGVHIPLQINGAPARPNSPCEPPSSPPQPSSRSSSAMSFSPHARSRPGSSLAARNPHGRGRPGSAVSTQDARNRLLKQIAKAATPTRPASAACLSRDLLRRTVAEGNNNRTGGPSATSVPQRPHSASGAFSASSPRTLHGASARVDPYTVREQRMRALHQAWLEDPRSGLHIGGPSGGPGPSPQLMDRHARCLEQLKPHPTSFREFYGGGAWAEGRTGETGPDRPRSAMGGAWEEPGMEEACVVGVGVGVAQERDNMSRVQRYIDCHRPQSAPSMRKDLEGAYRRKIGVRGRSPHFCNFVHKASVHTRPDSAQAHPSTGSDDDDGIGSMSEATDQDILAQWRKQSRLTGSGTEGRPGSPTSMNGRHGAKGDNDLTGRNSGSEDDTMNVSVIVNHIVNSEGESVARRDSKDDMADDKKKRPVPHRRTSSIGSVRKRPVKSRATTPDPIAKMIPTITIPSSPIPPADQSMSNRSSADQSSPRKSAREEPRPRASSARRSAERLPSASRQSPKEPQVPEPSKRPPVLRKTKKNTARRRKSKSVTMDVPASAERSAEGDASQGPAGGASQTTPEGLDVNAKIPDLPGLPPSGKDHGRKSRRSGRRLISPAQETGEKQKTPNDLLDPDTGSRAGYDFGDMETTSTDSYNNKLRLQTWLNNRMALSQRASRFELPMDMKVLENMTPQDYLKKFCIVSSRRVNLYQKIFVKHKDKTNLLSKQVLETCLKETLVQTLKPETFGDVCELLEITDSTVIDFKLFSGIAAITERILYPCYLTEDTVEKPEYQREQIEAADFEALDWKLHGIQVSPHMRKLLKMIE